MFLSRWSHCLRTAFARRCASKSARRVTRLSLERLEERTLPAFLTPPTAVVSNLTAPGPMVVGNFIQGGAPDLAVANGGATPQISLFLGNGTGGSTPRETFPVPGANRTTVRINVSDFNKDA